MNNQFKKVLFYKLTLAIVFIFTSPTLQAHLPVSQVHPLTSKGDILESAPRTRWANTYHIADDPKARKGVQVLHTASNKARHYNKNDFAREFVEKYCKDAIAFDTDAEVLEFASKQASKKGAIVEVGTGTAQSTQFLSALNPLKEIHTFDSFLGLPEAWDKGGSNRVFPKGTMGLRDLKSGYLPSVNNNVYIYVGEYEDTLSKFKEQILKDTPIALLNVDCCIYSSTKKVFDNWGNNIVPGTVIHFDEMYNYTNYKEHELKAFLEFIKKKGYTFKVIAFNAIHEQVAIRIEK